MNTTKRAIKAHASIARPGCYMTAEERQSYRATVEASELHDSAKRILKWLIGFKTPDMALSIDAIRERLPKTTKRDHEAVSAWKAPGSVAPNAKKAIMSARTIQRVIRLLEDDGLGIAVLRMVAEEKRGTKTPRVYEIDLAPITEDELMRISGVAATHNKRTNGVTGGVSLGVSTEVTSWGVTLAKKIQSDTSSDTLLLNTPVFSSSLGAEALCDVAKQPPAMTKAPLVRRSARLTHRPSVRTFLSPADRWLS